MKQVRKNSPIIILIVGLFIYSGCSKEKIPEETLVKVYVENVIAQETYSVNTDSLNAHKKAIFLKYKITEKDFREELLQYSENKLRWESFFQKANAYLTDLKKSNIIE